ncbi:MAG: cation transporter [Saprospiraceae bacterium]|nr:cation transporter [Saprospiraceae bacterium]
MSTPLRQNLSLRAQRLLLIVAILMMLVKLFAWYLTSSVAVMSDALESLVNVTAGFLGYYSLILSARPRDENHPYGHGKVEFISSAAEGVMIAMAGLWIIFESIRSILWTQEVRQLDLGIFLMVFAMVVHWVVGEYCIKVGRKNHSVALLASGTHIRSDAITSLGIVIGLFLVWWTGIDLIDAFVAILFAVFILISALKIIRKSISGIMDEVDLVMINDLIDVLHTNRRKNWIDIHHLRVVNYAGFMHIDCHLTVPRYFTVEESHEEIEMLHQILHHHFEGRIEMSIHTDPCISSQCGICSKADCPIRSSEFKFHHKWDMASITQNQKHQFDG